jgi:epoxyqueuosine reductase
VSEAPELPLRLSDRVKALALGLGFDLVGITEARPRRETRFFADWLGRGFAGEMEYLERQATQRIDPREILPAARSIIALGFVYDPGSRAPARPNSMEVARYAGGSDYHEVLQERVDALQDGLEPVAGRPVASRGFVDTGPVLERVHAAYAGLGWIGKNTCLIHPGFGSYLFLGAVLTDLELASDAREPDHCGSCRACLDACPTDAFPEPYVLDATRCIAYTTIEAKGPIPEPLREAHGDLGFGCDICQEVCPWNSRSRRSLPPDLHGLRARLAPRPEWKRPMLEWVLSLSETAWRNATRSTAVARAKHRGLLRNALVVAGNSGDAGLRPVIERLAEGSDAMLAEHARWALTRLR